MMIISQKLKYGQQKSLKYDLLSFKYLIRYMYSITTNKTMFSSWWPTALGGLFRLWFSFTYPSIGNYGWYTGCKIVWSNNARIAKIIVMLIDDWHTKPWRFLGTANRSPLFSYYPVIWGHNKKTLGHDSLID